MSRGFSAALSQTCLYCSHFYFEHVFKFYPNFFGVNDGENDVTDSFLRTPPPSEIEGSLFLMNIAQGKCKNYRNCKLNQDITYIACVLVSVCLSLRCCARTRVKQTDVDCRT